jgi:hypothetical protein
MGVSITLELITVDYTDAKNYFSISLNSHSQHKLIDPTIPFHDQPKFWIIKNHSLKERSVI